MTKIEQGQRFRNWSGSVSFTPAHQARPRSLEELQAFVRSAQHAGHKVRVRGSGHSFVPLVQTDDVLLDLDHMSGLESIEDNVATVWAGTKLDVLSNALWARGYAMTNLGDINKQSIGGAVGTGTHGTGLRLGSISTQVVGLSIVLANGELMECSAQQQPELFHAARVGLGALGIIAKLRIAVEPAYKLKLHKYTMELSACLAQAEQLARAHRHFEFYWFPHTEVVGVKTMDRSEERPSAQAFHKVSELVLENGTFGLISRVARLRPAWAPKLSQLVAWSIKGDEGTTITECHRAFSTVRLVHFHEQEYLVPAEHGPAALRELTKLIASARIQLHFPVEYRYLRGDDVWLSPAFGRDSAAISVHQYVGMEHADYFAAAERIFLRYGGRPHWGKMHSLDARQLAPLYPRWRDFQRVRDAVDPLRSFSNSFTDRLLGT